MIQELSHMQYAQGFLPVDMQAGANDGDWVSFKNYRKIQVVLYKAVGTAGDDPTITLEQATAVAGTAAKALAVITAVHRKQAAANLLAVGQYTKDTQAAAATYTNDTLAEMAAFVIIEVSAEDLDVAGGFDCMRARVADIGGNAQLGCMFYVGLDPVYETAPASLPSMIVD